MPHNDDKGKKNKKSKKVAAANGKDRPKKSTPKPLDSIPKPKKTKLAAAEGKTRPPPKKSKKRVS